MSSSEDAAAVWKPHKYLVKTRNFQVFLERQFERLGAAVGKNPTRHMAIVMTLLVLLTGLLPLFVSVETAGSQLWVPQRSPPKIHLEWIDDVYGPSVRFQTIYAWKDNANVLSPEHFSELFLLNDAVFSVELVDGRGAHDLCFKSHVVDPPVCVLPASALKFWKYNSTLFSASVLQAADPQQALLDAINVPSFSDGAPVVPQNLFGRVSLDDQGKVVSAEALSWWWYLEAQVGSDESAWEWEEGSIDILKAVGDLPLLDYSFAFYRSVDDELARAVGADVFLFVLTFVLMTTVLSLSLGRLHRVRSRLVLGSFGVLGTFLAIGAGYGVASAVGVTFTSLTQILPFILVGIGVDGMLIISTGFDQTDPSLPEHRRLALAYKKVGPSVTTTSLTDIMAFMLGASTVIPAVKWFCFYASLALLFNFVQVFTVFGPMLLWDARRQRAGRMDVLCCVRVRRGADKKQVEGKEEEEEQESQDVAKSVDKNSATRRSKENTDDEELRDLSMAQRLFGAVYSRLLSHPLARAFVVLSFAGITGVCLWSVTQLKTDFQLADLAPDDSYLIPFYHAEDTYFSDKLNSLDVYVRDQPFHERTTQESIARYHSDMRSSQYAAPDTPLVSWLPAYQEYYRAHPALSLSLDEDGYLTDSTLFYSGLQQFLALDQSEIFRNNLRYLPSDSPAVVPVLQAARSSILIQPPPLDDKVTFRVDQMMAFRDISKQSDINTRSGVDQPPWMAFDYMEFYIFIEQFNVIFKELIMNLVLALLAVVLITAILLVHPLVCGLVALSVLLVDVDLLGSVYMWGLDINSITIINLIMAIGLVVDYSAHVAHAYVHQTKGNRLERIIHGLTFMGPAIFMGGITTFVGVLPLAAASSEVFRVFFKMFVGIIVFGLLHGLLLLPVLLAYFAPVMHWEQVTCGETRSSSISMMPALTPSAKPAGLRPRAASVSPSSSNYYSLSSTTTAAPVAAAAAHPSRGSHSSISISISASEPRRSSVSSHDEANASRDLEGTIPE